MQHLVDDVRRAVAAESWHAAIALTLALPDICGYVETPFVTGSQKRFARWFVTNVQPLYTRSLLLPDETTPHVFLSGNDAYALRCAFLHNGAFDITDQRAQDVLDRFEFIVPPRGSSAHRCQINQRLVLQVDLFCDDICSAVERWIAQQTDADVVARLNALPRVRVAVPGQPFSF